jgi:predicted lipid-binding transport protein (Tim44 family)
MSAKSAARRVRRKFMRFGFWTSSVAFVVIEGDALLDQSEIGHASLLFMFGTAYLAAAACIGLFAIISAIGLAVSSAFRDDPPRQQSVHHDATAAVTDAPLGLFPAASLALEASTRAVPPP